MLLTWLRYDHDIKGQGIYAYVSLHEGYDFSDDIRKDLVKTVREQIGAFAAPDVIHWAPGETRLALGFFGLRVYGFPRQKRITRRSTHVRGMTSSIRLPVRLFWELRIFRSQDVYRVSLSTLS
jgi:acetyl-CoA synthetase